MAAFTLKLGNLDLSNYLRVAQGDGLDPLDSSGFIDPQFSDSVIAEGQPLISVTQSNREMVFPLYLRSTTMDALADLMQSINSEIANTRPLVLEWKDQGATNSTFFDVTFARFDPEYNYRRAGGNGNAKWMGGTLRVYASPPYGHTGTTRVIATAVASGNSVLVPIPSALDGDIAAQLRVQIQHAVAQTWDGDQLAVSVLPNASWNPVINASQFLNPLLGGAWNSTLGVIQHASIGAASGAPGGVAYNVAIQPIFYDESNVQPNNYYNYADRLFSFALSGSVYSGNIRVLAAVRAPLWPGLNVGMTDQTGIPVGNFSTATGWRGYSLVDLGRVSMPTGIGGATKVFNVAMNSANVFAVANAAPAFVKDYGALLGTSECGDPYALQFAQLYVLPEDSTQFFLDSDRKPAFNINFVDNQSHTPIDVASDFTDALGVTWSTTSGTAVRDYGYRASNSAATPPNLRPDVGFANNWNIEVEYDDIAVTPILAATTTFGVARFIGGFSSVLAVSINHTASTNSLSIGGLGLPVACTAFPMVASNPLNWAEGRVILRCKMQGDTAAASVEYFNYSATAGLATYTLLASMVASQAAFNSRGIISFQPGAYARIRTIRGHYSPSYAEVPSGSFLVDTNQRVAQYLAAGGSYLRDIKNQRGGYQTLPSPSPAAVFALRQPIDAPADKTGVIISARERFTFFR
jgi:hypothetical protein